MPIGFLASYLGSILGKQSAADEIRAREVILEANLDLPDEYVPSPEKVSTKP